MSLVMLGLWKWAWISCFVYVSAMQGMQSRGLAKGGEVMLCILPSKVGWVGGGGSF